MMTLACATIIVAGGASAAVDKAVQAEVAQPVKAGLTRAQMSLRQRVSNWNVSASVFGSESCDCLWENGEWDGQDAQASHEGGAFPQGVKAADDFYLCEGFVYDLESICGWLCTDTLPQLYKARLELYSDCNGRPDELLYTFKNSVVAPTGQFFDGYELVKYTFTVANQGDPSRDNRNELACIRNIVLKGGTYWVSLIGISDNRCITMPNMCDSSFFATTGLGVIKGSVAHKIEGRDTGMWNQYDYSGQEWAPLDECCIGCTDLAFTVCAEPCKILIDNGSADAVFIGEGGAERRVGSRSERSTSPSRNSRAADDFVVNPCFDLLVCYIEGCIYSNCVPSQDGSPGFTAWYDIYDNDCKEPSYVLGREPLFKGSATCIIDLGYSVTIDGRSGLTGYLVQFHDIENVRLPKGKQYWISLSAADTFGQNERAYFCYNADCRRDCLIRFNPGHILGGLRSDGNLRTQWESVGRDFSFLIAGENADELNGSGSTPACASDFNRDGNSTLDDLFAFLQAWFAGCP
ncbi:MAG: hypothetical protein SH850_12785 [Planctomycetaceae bacterium]|nr:hypothetical protein [Planctomycetaceae bacterium]